MRKTFLFAFLFASLCASAQITQSFNLGVWGDPNASNLNYVPSDYPSDLVWDDNLVTICFQSQLDSSVVSNFHLTEKTLDCPYVTEYKECYMTKEGFLIDFGGFYNNGDKTIIIVNIYFEGKQVGILNYPTIF